MVNKFGEKTGAYASSRVLTRDDGKYDSSGNPRNSRPKEHAREVEHASARGNGPISKNGAVDGLAASLPRGMSFGGGGVTRVVGPRSVRGYVK